MAARRFRKLPAWSGSLSPSAERDCQAARSVRFAPDPPRSVVLKRWRPSAAVSGGGGRGEGSPGAEANVATEEAAPPARPRLHVPHERSLGAGRAQGAPAQGPSPPDRQRPEVHLHGGFGLVLLHHGRERVVGLAGIVHEAEKALALDGLAEGLQGRLVGEVDRMGLHGAAGMGAGQLVGERQGGVAGGAVGEVHVVAGGRTSRRNLGGQRTTRCRVRSAVRNEPDRPR